MALVTALRDATNGLARNPVLFAATGVFVLLQVPLFAGRLLGPVASLAVSSLSGLVFVLVTPFFQAGLVAMADEAIDGRTRLGTLTERGREHYVTMLVAYLVLVGVNSVVGFVVLVGVFVVGILVVASAGAGGVSPVLLAVAGVVGLVLVVLYAALLFLVQFYGQAIVVDGADSLESFQRSAGLVRDNLASTLGYTVLVAVVGSLFGLVGGLASLLTSAQQPAVEVPALPELSTAGTVGLLVAVLVVSIPVSAFTLTLSVAFYRTLRADGGD